MKTSTIAHKMKVFSISSPSRGWKPHLCVGDCGKDFDEELAMAIALRVVEFHSS
ncbi:hypothetical protein H6G41_09430 [Tolypothrix sp. FACHB-123]|uniref:hypothetical protein n=1 Tax=Tolypothrix sp. FACHB-123 TaxID=2692868 RepID=UPI001687C397|nr:hypothetical protein [Tolypothrix sp. FACHB-123]MBD2354840.1 hypothetical protein [Tolypothrix sp. FACHB-123]